MKRNLLKRIGAVALAVAVSLTMGTAAFAADDPATLTNGVAKDGNKANGFNSVGSSISFDKEIVLMNPTKETTVYAPKITFNYAIAPANPESATVTDADNAKASVKAPPANTINTSGSTLTAAFTNTDSVSVTDITNGTAVSKPIKVAFVVSNFPSAGIYRYKISESVAAAADGAAGTRDAAGISNTSYAADRYLDVYVKNGANNTKEIYGYVLFEGTDTTSITKDTKKSQGYVHTDGSTADVDLYKTTNLTVTKDIEGTLADMTNKFPFQIGLANSSLTYTAHKFMYGTTAAAFTSSNNYVVGTLAADSALKLGEQESAVFTAVPLGVTTTTTYQANEFNNTSDTYSVKVDTGTPSNLAGGAATQNAATNLTASEVSTKFVNTLDTISPTNVVMRFAPYLFILGAAIVLLVLMRRRRASQDAE